MTRQNVGRQLNCTITRWRISLNGVGCPHSCQVSIVAYVRPLCTPLSRVQMVAALCDRPAQRTGVPHCDSRCDGKFTPKAARAKTFTAAQAHEILRECVALSTGEPSRTFACRQWLEERLAGKSGATANRDKRQGAVKGFSLGLGTPRGRRPRCVQSQRYCLKYGERRSSQRTIRVRRTSDRSDEGVAGQV